MSTGARILRPAGARRGGEELARIDRALAATQLEMQLRLANPPGRANLGNLLALANGIAALDEQLLAMRIGGDPAIGMLDQDQIAVAAQLIAGICDSSGVDRGHRGAARRGDVDAVIVFAARRDPVPGKDVAAHRPGEMAAM